MSSPSTDKHARPLDHATKRAIVIGVLAPMFLGAIDLTLVATALPAIAAGLNDFDNISWVVTAYLLAVTVMTPLFGKLSDLYGRRNLMLVAIILSAAGTIIAALAPNMLVLIFGRIVQGIGGGGTIPIAQTIIAEITTPYERPKYQGYTSGMFMVATVGGPAVGGLIADNLHWSFVFWINLPLAVAALISCATVLGKVPRHDRPHQLDVLGAILMMAAGLALMLAMTWGGRRYAWGSPEILGLLALSAVLWTGFGWRMLHAHEPFVPLNVLRNATVRYSTGCAFFGVGTIIGLTILVPLYFKIGLGLTATKSGFAVMALQGGATITSIGATFFIVRMERYMRVPLAAIAFASVLLAVLVIEPVKLPLWLILILIAGIGCGLGPLFPMSFLLIQNVIAPRELGIATGVAAFFRSLGGTFIVAAFGAIMLAGAGPAGVAVDPNIFRWVFAGAIACLIITAIFLSRVEQLPWHGASAD